MYVVDDVTVNYERLNKTVEETTVLTYQCDSGFSLTGPNTISCTNAGVWSTDPQKIMCVQILTTAETGELSVSFIIKLTAFHICHQYTIQHTTCVFTFCIEHVCTLLRNSKHCVIIIFLNAQLLLLQLQLPSLPM